MKVTDASLLNNLNTLDRFKAESDKAKKGFGLEDQGTGAEDSFRKMLETVDADATYTNLKTDMNTLAVQTLMKGIDDIPGSIKEMVTELLERQGITIDQLKSGEVENVKVDDIARARAQEMIGPGGEFSPEKVSDRIVNFAISVVGGDKEKIDLIRSSIDKGFKEAEKIVGTLPDISNETYDLIQEKLDKWLEGDSEKAVEKQPEAGE